MVARTQEFHLGGHQGELLVLQTAKDFPSCERENQLGAGMVLGGRFLSPLWNVLWDAQVIG